MKKIALMFLVASMALMGCSFDEDITNTTRNMGYTNCSEPEAVWFSLNMNTYCGKDVRAFRVTCVSPATHARVNMVACCVPFVGCRIGPQ